MKLIFTIEETFGWVYFYGAKDPELEIGGNAPFIVNAETGEIEETGTADELDIILKTIKNMEHAIPED